MKGFCFFLVAVFLTASLSTAAEPQQIMVWKLDGGYYVVSGSSIVAFPPSGPIVPPDGPVVPPVVPPQTAFAKAVTDAVTAIPATPKRNELALKLVAVYKMLEDNVSSGKIHPTSAVMAAEWICGPALGSDAAIWSVVFAVVNEAVGSAGTPEATAAVFGEAAATILATVPNSADALEIMQSGKMMGENEEFAKLAEVYGIDWDKFLMMLLDLFIKLLPLIISAVEKLSLVLFC